MELIQADSDIPVEMIGELSRSAARIIQNLKNMDTSLISMKSKTGNKVADQIKYKVIKLKFESIIRITFTLYRL